jgi:hypothetical protein
MQELQTQALVMRETAKHTVVDAPGEQSAPKRKKTAKPASTAHQVGRKFASLTLMWASNDHVFQNLEGDTPRPKSLSTTETVEMKGYVKHIVKRFFASLSLEEKHGWGTSEYKTCCPIGNCPTIKPVVYA